MKILTLLAISILMGSFLQPAFADTWQSSPPPWNPNLTAHDFDPNITTLNFGGGTAQGIEPHGGCINGDYLAGPGDPDGSLHMYPVPRQDQCH